MKIVKGYTKQVNGGKLEFITEEEYYQLMEEYEQTCDSKGVISEPDFQTTLYSFYEQRNIIKLGWAYYPQF